MPDGLERKHRLVLHEKFLHNSSVLTSVSESVSNLTPWLVQTIERSRIGLVLANKKTLRRLDETLDCDVQRR